MMVNKILTLLKPIKMSLEIYIKKNDKLSRQKLKRPLVKLSSQAHKNYNIFPKNIAPLEYLSYKMFHSSLESL